MECCKCQIKVKLLLVTLKRVIINTRFFLGKWILYILDDVIITFQPILCAVFIRHIAQRKIEFLQMSFLFRFLRDLWKNEIKSLNNIIIMNDNKKIKKYIFP